MRAIVFAALMLAGCAQAQGAPAAATQSLAAQQIRADLARLDGELHAAGVVAASIGEAADLGGVTIRPLEVVEDSRCPNNVQCIWAGRLRLRAAVSGVSGDSVLTLGEPLQTSNGAVVLAIASPGPWAEWPESEIGPKPAYRFGFRRA